MQQLIALCFIFVAIRGVQSFIHTISYWRVIMHVNEGRSVSPLDCHIIVFIVNGSFGEWSPFSHCNVTCGGGVEYRSRIFDGDDDENEEETEFRICNTLVCPGKTI